MMNAGFTHLLVLLLATILMAAAVIDWRTFRISNRLNLAVAALALPFWLVSGTTFWPGVPVQLALAAGAFALFALMFHAGLMGGGDVKLAAALGLWFPPLAYLHFLVWMSLAGGLLTAALLLVHRVRAAEGRPRIPYGVAIAAGALVILAEPYLNHFG
jgi:prepilin peptidase CpaA